MILGLGDLMDMLSITNNKIFALETQARRKDITNEERGKLTLKIRELNDKKRIPLKNAISKYADKDFYEEIKIK